MRLVVVELAVLALGRGPAFPAVGLVEDVGVFLSLERGFVGLVLLQAVEVFQEEQPGGLLGVVELGGAAGFFPENVVDVLEGLFEHCLVGERSNNLLLYHAIPGEAQYFVAGRPPFAVPSAVKLESCPGHKAKS